MKMIWHIMKKDFRAVWPLWLAWMGLIAVRIPWLVFYLTTASERTVKLLEVTSIFAFIADILLVFMVVGNVVHEDPLPSDRAFWATRPVSAGQLCVAKLLTLLVICVLSPLVFLLPTWAVFGVDAANIGKLLAYHGALNGGAMLIALLFAVVTRKAATYAVFSLVALALVGVIAITVDSGFGISVARRAVIYWSIVGAGVVLGVVAVVQQYLTRNTRRTWCLLGVLVVSAGLVLPSSSGKSVFQRSVNLPPSEIKARAEWKDQKLVLATKPEGAVAGSIQVVSDDQIGSIRLRFLQGKWIGQDGFSEPVKMMKSEDDDGRISWIEPRSIDFDAREKIYRFPVQLRIPDGFAGRATLGFEGRVGIIGMKPVKLAELPLAAGATVSAIGLRARLLDLKNYEKAVTAVILQATAISVANGHGKIVNTDPAKKWSMSSIAHRGSGVLLWLELQRFNLMYGKDRIPQTPDAWVKNTVGPQIQEALAEQGWRVEWREYEPTFYEVCELKAERLEIAKE